MSTGSYNTKYIKQSGTTTATNVGTYTVTFELIDTVNTCWSDNTTSIKKQELDYRKKEEYPHLVFMEHTIIMVQKQTVTLTGLNSSIINVSGITSATNAGTYTIILSLKDKDNYSWGKR
ncbi:MAG: hypothetical protein L6U99_01010 [Clostridium sp.]|nr:MAG: hypothetical protein L6U99_01010 [Clostridium sp.]